MVLGYRPDIEFSKSFNKKSKVSFEPLKISNGKAKSFGIELGSDFDYEIDNLLLCCRSWFH